MTKLQELSLLLAANLVLKTHGLHDDCDGRPDWAGNSAQRRALNDLHTALCDCLPSLPSQQQQEVSQQ